MILSEKYDKTMLYNKIYDTVLLADIIELNNEMYFIVSGYLFNSKESDDISSKINEEYINDTFFSRDNTSDLDAYYLIYNMDTKQIINNKSKFIQENDLNKIIRLDKTKCEQVNIGKDVAYKINTNNEEYLFMEFNNEELPYILMKNGEDGLCTQNMITFNKEKNKVDIVDEFKYMKQKVKELESINITKLANDTNKFYKKIVINNKELKEES